jgi:signal peptidase I
VTTIDFPSLASLASAPSRSTQPAAQRSARSIHRSAVPAVAVPAVRTSLWKRLGNLFGTLLMIVAIIAVLFFAIGPRFLGYQTATMLTGSMAPEIMPGDVVVTTLQPVSGIAVGDVISYHIPVEDHRVETHRVTEVIRGADGSTAVRTQGDANEAVDPWVATLDGDHVYGATAVIPEVGNVIRALRTPIVSQVLMYGVPAVLVGALLLIIWSRPEDEDDAGTTRSTTTNDGPPAPHSTPDRTDVARLPVLERQTLDNLGLELASPGGALQFAQTFADMLPERLRAVEEALVAQDADAAVVALLSLNVSAAMVGARRLEEMSSTALGLVDDPAAHAMVIEQLQRFGAEFQSALGGTIR